MAILCLYLQVSINRKKIIILDNIMLYNLKENISRSAHIYRKKIVLLKT